MPAAFATVWAAAGSVAPLIVMLPDTMLLGPPRPGVALPPTQLFVTVKSPVWLEALAFAVIHELQPEKMLPVIVR